MLQTAQVSADTTFDESNLTLLVFCSGDLSHTTKKLTNRWAFLIEGIFARATAGKARALFQSE